ncbi:hypothetical protein BM221_005810 [Beauveria bassiana]|uniref:Uncharacterized protein n=1 Tax=Beauveria bassiana TaxID=176275 RepID=A0A2N6NK45_BEABA|nr:hypothetical protein BM221_005810 [Beauveria bassiana]
MRWFTADATYTSDMKDAHAEANSALHGMASASRHNSIIAAANRWNMVPLSTLTSRSTDSGAIDECAAIFKIRSFRGGREASCL